MTRKSELLVVLSIAAIFVLAGLGMLFGGWNLYSKQKALQLGGIEVEGRIVGFERVGPGPTNRLQDSFSVPWVAFKTESGRELTFLGDGG